MLDGTSRYEDESDSDDVDSELELDEFGNRIVHVSAPHDGLHDTSKVVVCEDDIGSFLGDVGSGDALKHSTGQMTNRASIK